MAAAAVATAVKASPSTLLVKNSTLNTRVIGVTGHIHGLKLDKGWNVVPVEEWTAAKKIASVRDELKGTIKVPAIYVEKEFPEGSSEDLSGFSEEDAADIVRETNRVALIEQWGLGEKRKSVLSAMHDRTKELAERK